MLHTRVAGIESETAASAASRLARRPDREESAGRGGSRGERRRRLGQRSGRPGRGRASTCSYSKGSLLITDQRLTQRVINRLRPASDADILVPGGTVSILGTTSSAWTPWTGSSRPSRRATTSSTRPGHGAGAGRPPATSAPTPASGRWSGSPESAGRPVGLSRGFALLDHAARRGRQFRVDHRRQADDLSPHGRKDRRPGLRAAGGEPPLPDAGSSRSRPLPPTSGPRRAVPAALAAGPTAPTTCCCASAKWCRPAPWMRSSTGSASRAGASDLYAIGRRSRIGKGTCQGAFCGAAHQRLPLRPRASSPARQGLADLRSFLSARWRGMRPILWDTALLQEELQEALHCGYLGLELEDRAVTDRRAHRLRCLRRRKRHGRHVAPRSSRRTGGLSTVLVGRTGEIIFATGLLDLLAVHPLEEGEIWDDPWAGMAALVKDLPRHPYARLPAGEIRVGLRRGCCGFSRHKACPTRGMPDRNVGRPDVGRHPQDDLPRAADDVAGGVGLERRAPCLLVDIQGLKGFSARQIADTLAPVWPGLRTARVVLPGTHAGRARSLRSAWPARSNSANNREKFADALSPSSGGRRRGPARHSGGFQLGGASCSDIERRLGVAVFEIPTMPPGVDGAAPEGSLRAGPEGPAG